ncbi:NmrA family NAD(P)-binding protein [Nonomuraea sp. ZG12]|uniref:NmrA family NAD(P)-binding protein n=1 Tax=Nonomuraea sp. ZG12 TaxID=3452207 RepID=UPI003F8BB150
MTYLVTGATGKAGRHVVDHLLQAGQQVRALTRDPAKANLPPQVEVVAGDLTVPESLAPAFDGVTGVHLLTVGGDDYATLRTAPDIVALALKAGVRRATVLWNGQLGPVEEAVEASELEWTRLQPVDFMGNTLGWAESIRTEDSVREPFGDVPAAMVHEADVGAAAAVALVEPGHAGKIYTLTGPEALTPRRRLDIIAAVIGRELRFDELTEEQARERWRQASHGEELIDLLAAWQGNPPPAAYTVVPTVEDLTGRPARSFTEWVHGHTAHFG